MCSAQKLHTYTDFEIDKQYFFSAFSQLHEVFLKYDTYASNCWTDYTEHDGIPLFVQFTLSMMAFPCLAQNLLWFGKVIRY